jgi:plastocyanin
MKSILIILGVVVLTGVGYAYYQGVQHPSATTSEAGTDSINGGEPRGMAVVNGDTNKDYTPGADNSTGGSLGNVEDTNAQNTNTQAGDTATARGDAASVKTFNLTAKNFSFSPSEIRVKKGDTVKVVMNSVNGFHDFVVDAFNAKTDRVSDGQTAEVQFVADKTGTFDFYCSVGNHRAMGMVGKLIVE